jgi:hypothetical protein
MSNMGSCEEYGRFAHKVCHCQAVLDEGLDSRDKDRDLDLDSLISAVPLRFVLSLAVCDSLPLHV